MGNGTTDFFVPNGVDRIKCTAVDRRTTATAVLSRGTMIQRISAVTDYSEKNYLLRNNIVEKASWKQSLYTAAI